MTYRGQLIQEFQLDLDFGSFENYQRQISTFARFMQTMMGIIAIFVILRGLDTFNAFDFVLWTLFVASVIFLLQRVIDRLQNTEIENDKLPPLLIFEYGIQLPSVLSEEESEADIFVTYNQMMEIEIHEDTVIIKGDKNFVISTYLIKNDQIELFEKMFKRLFSKIEEVENREFPTIIPRAYFKDLLS